MLFIYFDSIGSTSTLFFLYLDAFMGFRKSAMIRSEATIKKYFLNGLPPEIKSKYDERRKNRKKKLSLTKVLEDAYDMEKYTGHGSSMKRKSTPITPSRKERYDNQDKQKKPDDSRRQSQSSAKAGIICFNCNGAGHYSSDCPSAPKSRKPSVPVTNSATASPAQAGTRMPQAQPSTPKGSAGKTVRSVYQNEEESVVRQIIRKIQELESPKAPSEYVLRGFIKGVSVKIVIDSRSTENCMSVATAEELGQREGIDSILQPSQQ
jgi:hypothetical protein